MIKIAVLSDVHSNWYALNSVISQSEFQNCDLIIFGGDAVGYYYQPEKVINYLRKKSDFAIKGNHDEMLQASFENDKKIAKDYKRKYGSGLSIAIKTISQTNYEWLAGLPETLDLVINNCLIKINHGSPLRKNGYFYPDSPVNKRTAIFNLGYDCVLIGHSHYQFIFKKHNQLIVNPGSVGQSRDRGGYAGWAIMEIGAKRIEATLKQTKYDIFPLLKDVKHYNPENRFLSEVLFRK
jgi:predicted phosphodiesterase